MMFASASGVLKQRASPNARCSPNVMPNTPPLPGHLVDHVRVGVGDVLAEHADAFVARHLLVQREPDRLAERDGLGVVGAVRFAGIVGHGHRARRRDRRTRLGSRARRRERRFGRGAHRLLRLGAHLLGGLGGEHAGRDQLLFEHGDRIVLALVVELLGDAVLLLVVGERVRVRPGDERVHETRARRRRARARSRSRPCAAPRSSRGRPSSRRAGRGCRAPSPRSAPGADRSTAPRSRSRCRRRRTAPGGAGGVAVFSDSQNSPSDVAPSPSDTYVSSSPCAVQPGQMRAPADVARRFRAPDRGQALARGDRRLADDVEPASNPSGTASGGRPTPGSAAAPTACISISSGRDAERERERAVAVVGEEPVVPGAQRAGEAEQQRLVARRPRSGRTPGSAGGARSRGRRRSGRRARGGSRRAPRRVPASERSVECGVVH